MTDPTTTTNRYACIHGHFYQPPRESPWLEAVEPEDSAYPYHDWNDRITEECYGPNSASRILDGDGRIGEILNNYAYMSFNFGPTLLSWMAVNAPATYRKILQADRDSQKRFGGHGSAMAQAYNHMILPLANDRDVRTQVRWGIRDFSHRFRRPPEGMWLPETAADTRTLAILAQEGIRFTVLAPHQAARLRQDGAALWQPAPPGGPDTGQPYRVSFAGGGSLAVFFYDGPLSRAVAFEHLLDNGEGFARRLVDRLSAGPERPTLAHMATDGETYGHHHRFGDMALAWVLRHLAGAPDVRLTNYGQFLDLRGPEAEVAIRDATSWSCEHGVARWREDCGCTTGGRPGWNQAWRGPLREGLDLVRDSVTDPFERLAARFLTDPWAARDDYVSVILDRSEASIARFVDSHARPGIEPDVPRILKLMELQRHAMLMYTSCGFFFDDISRIETVQVMKYAARVAQLADDLFGLDVQTPFLDILGRARSNAAGEGTGATVYARRVQPFVLDLRTVARHYAVASVFEDHPSRIYCYQAERRTFQLERAGAVKFAVGNVTIRSDITREAMPFAYAALHLGDHRVRAGVGLADGTEEGLVAQVMDEARAAIARNNPEAVEAILHARFAHATSSLRDLFRDERRRILTHLMNDVAAEAGRSLRRVFDEHAFLVRFLADLDMPLPAAFETAVRFVLRQEVLRELAAAEPDAEVVARQIDEANRFGIVFDDRGLVFAFGRALERLATTLAGQGDLATLERLTRLVALTERLGVGVELWQTQNTVFEAKTRLLAAGGGTAWDEALSALARNLGLRLEG